jgi:hypothetical protein
MNIFIIVILVIIIIDILMKIGLRRIIDIKSIIPNLM